MVVSRFFPKKSVCAYPLENGASFFIFLKLKQLHTFQSHLNKSELVVGMACLWKCLRETWGTMATYLQRKMRIWWCLQECTKWAVLCLKIEKYASLESFNFSLLVLNIVCHGKLCEFEAICITYLFSLKFLGTNILALSLFSDSKRLLCLTLDLPKDFAALEMHNCLALYSRACVSALPNIQLPDKYLTE